MIENSAGVLKASVTMEQGMGIRVSFNGLIEGLVNKWIIVSFAENIGHNTPVIQVQDGAQIELMDRKAFIPFEFCHIGKPFLVCLYSIKLTIQKVFRNMLRVFGLPGAAMVIVFHSGPYISGPADTQHPLVIDVDTMVMPQIVIESSVTFIRVFIMDLFNLVSQTFIFRGSAAQFP